MGLWSAMQSASTWKGFEYLQNSSKVWPKILSMALEEELEVLDFVVPLKYYYVVFLDCFLLLLHLLTS